MAIVVPLFVKERLISHTLAPNGSNDQQSLSFTEIKKGGGKRMVYHPSESKRRPWCKDAAQDCSKQGCQCAEPHFTEPHVLVQGKGKKDKASLQDWWLEVKVMTDEIRYNRVQCNISDNPQQSEDGGEKKKGRTCNYLFQKQLCSRRFPSSKLRLMTGCLHYSSSGGLFCSYWRQCSIEQ